MARINIEDSLFLDERMKYLIRKKGEELAFGMWLRVAKCAQRYWAEGGLIPENVWNISEFDSALLESGLVEKREDGFYLKGSEEQFSWLASKKENGRRGGLKSGEVRKNKQLVEANGSESKRSPSETNPLTLTLTPTLTLNKTSNMHKEHISPKTPKPVFDLERVYKSYPRKEGKTAGLKKLTREIKTEDDFKLFEQAVVNYSEHVCINQTEQRYIKHFSSFVSTWRDWIDFSPAKQTNNRPGDGRCALASKVTVNLKTAVARFGRHNYEEVKEFLGDDVKYIALIGRTWLQICETQEKEWGNIQRMLEHVVKK